MPLKKVLASSKRKLGQEDGPIKEPPRSKKVPRGSGDTPSRNVAKTAKPPKEQVHFSGSDPKDEEVVERGKVPKAQVPRKKPKRMAGVYEGCKPAFHCRPPIFHSYNPIPRINNLPDPGTGIVLSEDNCNDPEF